MKRLARLAGSVFCAVTIAVITGWPYLIHFARTSDFTEQYVNQVIWTVAWLGLIASATLTAVFYRRIR